MCVVKIDDILAEKYLIDFNSTQKNKKCQIKTYILKLTRSLFRIYATIYSLLRRI